MKFLIIDDNPFDRELVSLKLRQEFPGAEFVEVGRREDLDATLASDDIDVILTDYRLGWSDGLMILEIAKERLPLVPVVMVTDTGSEEIAAQGMKRGLSAYVLKRNLAHLPLSVKESMEKVRLAAQYARAAEDLRVSEERHRIVSELTSDYAYVLRLSVDGKPAIEWLTDAFTRMTGYTIDEIQTRDAWPNMIHQDDRQHALQDIGRAIAGEAGVSEYRIITKRGEMRWLRDFRRPVWDAEQERVVAIYGGAQDITNQKLAERTIVESEQRYRSLFEHNSAAVFSIDLDGCVRTANPACERVSGYAVDEILRQPVWSIAIAEEWERVREYFHQAAQGHPQQFEAAIAHADGSRVELSLIYVPIIVDDEVVGVYGIANDITEQKTLHKRLTHQAFHDSLTGLPNRAFFLERLERALDLACREQQTLAVLFLDLDNFKVINDSLGHDIGDQFLVVVAQRLQGCLRSCDTVARFGGDEFMVLVEDVDGAGDAIRIAERIEQALTSPIMILGRSLITTPSIGIALSTACEDEASDLLRAADLALYRAKHLGKGRYAVFDASMNDEAHARLTIEEDLRHALERGELHLEYQPLVDLNNSMIGGVEALVRWRHPERGLVSPGQFIPVAEDSGLIVPIGNWVLREACRQARAWQLQYPNRPPLTMSVNMSSKQFRSATLIEDIASALRQTGLDPCCLELEITEGLLMERTGAMIATVRHLKEMGIRIAIDDFGTGYSSLAYLKHFPIDTVKIDRSFVRDLAEQSDDRALVGAIIAAAKALRLHVTAEGIETAEQLAILRGMGCTRGQGFYFARPGASEVIERLVYGRLGLVDDVRADMMVREVV